MNESKQASFCKTIFRTPLSPCQKSMGDTNLKYTQHSTFSSKDLSRWKVIADVKMNVVKLQDLSQFGFKTLREKEKMLILAFFSSFSHNV